MKLRMPILFAIVTTLASQASLAGPEADKVWSQPGTGLMWGRCIIGGYSFEPHCSDQQNDVKSDYTWNEAVIAADALVYAGYDDWRLPTAEELQSLQTCKYEEGSEQAAQAKEWAATGQFEKLGLPFGCVSKNDIRIPPELTRSPISGVWTSSLISDYPVAPKLKPGELDTINRLVRSAKLGVDDPATTKPVPAVPADFNPVQSDYVLIWGDGRASVTNKLRSGKLLVVRGGKGKNRADAIVRRAKAETGSIDEHYAKEEERYAQQVEEQKQKSLQAHADMRKQRADYEQKTIQLRKSVKPGDKLANGTVIAVKGEMVHVQIMKQVCTNFGTTLNPYTRQPDCFKYERVPDGTGWFNRSEILPEKTP